MKPHSLPACCPPGRPLRAPGFTLVELMITIAISAILLGLAAPSFSSFIKSQTVRTASSDLNAALIFARSEAIKRNSDVVITPASGGWQNGWTVTVTTVAGVDSTASTTTLGSQASFSGLTITGPTGGLTYGSDGRLAGTTMPTFQISGSASTRCVSVGLSGVPMSKTGSC
ncbi:GspH/FimT family pseudopilin [Noviherbaspirillum sp. UKPF54]|uniref:GspH/FimT family pseudopilin n=1 Tax=Noviherbaspirillum sp. UKPF54 TaxID=2601898 RepID=UPI0011B1AB13|nr:GspH/FimT family pseudopilin [Noviherbaspirillum sp. UKPF54]QDZ27210.1 prepilin-type N-terminal cleavage/methylation domain-containing protein [Noviherbaspirillum sp. UKPF54]